MIHAERRGPVVLVTIDRAERRNAVDTEHLLAIRTQIESVGDARVFVLTGAGGHFCAGADLGGVEDAEFVAMLRGVLDGLRALPIVVIAAVEGVALGAGTQLAVACDLRVATADSRFGIPAAKLGLMVDHWTVGRVAVAGHGPARAMLLAAEVIDGERAAGLGLVQRVGGLDAAMAWAEEIAALAPLTIAGHKLALERLEWAYDDDDVRAAVARAWGSEDLSEGMAAFRDRRPPAFRGR
jgi:enoyl-CoA hydratase